MMIRAHETHTERYRSGDSRRFGRLLMVFYTTSFREDYRSLNEGRTNDIYYAYIDYYLNNILAMKTRLDECVILSCVTSESYDEVYHPGLRLIGANLDPYRSGKRLLSLIEGIAPSHLIVRSPLAGVLAWAANTGVRTLACFASSWEGRGVRKTIERHRLARLLNRPAIEWVSNHGVNSCLGLQRLGVDPDKIVPHDYPHVWHPEYAPKVLRESPDSYQILFVGTVREDKGVGDAIRSMRILTAHRHKVNLKVVGPGDIANMSRLARELAVDHAVSFVGSIPNSDVIPLMHASDLVLIPSHHEYPEGLPLTIFEALRSRTPVVASDHPMFKGHLEDGTGAVVFRAGDSKSLAAGVERLLSDPDLYRRLSSNARQIWHDMQIPTKVGAVESAWVEDSPRSKRWLFEHRLSSGLYRLTPHDRK